MSAATVLPAPGRFSTTNCWPRAAVHFAASIRASVSGLPPGASPTRTRTGFCGQAWGIAAPDQAVAMSDRKSAKRFISPPNRSKLGVHPQQVRNRFRRPPPEAAFGCNPEVARVFRGDCNSLPRALDPVRVVYQSEEELRLRGELQLRQRSEIGVVAAIGWHWHMNIIDRPVQLPEKQVVNLHHVSGALRLFPVATAVATVAQMHPKLDIGRHSVAMQREPLYDPGLHVGEMRVPHPFPLTHLGGDIPLQGKIAVRNGRKDLVDLG